MSSNPLNDLTAAQWVSHCIFICVDKGLIDEDRAEGMLAWFRKRNRHFRWAGYIIIAQAVIIGLLFSLLVLR